VIVALIMPNGSICQDMPTNQTHISVMIVYHPDYTWLGEKVANLNMRFYFFKERMKRKFKNWWKKHIVDTVPKEMDDLF